MTYAVLFVAFVLPILIIIGCGIDALVYKIRHRR